MNRALRIIFMGTPDFAVPSLDVLLKNNYNVVGVVTVPDKPAGRGQQIQLSAIKAYALEKGLNILQPEKLKSENFITQLKELKADLQVVVAFRMLPEIVWKMPALGTFNLHSSLLPQYRGAAPINWAIINGESKTGVTTFFLQHEIDTGKIILQEGTSIGENETAGELHDRLMKMGADLVLKTIRAIESKSYSETDQSAIISGNDVEKLKEAKKIFKDDCRINWNQSAKEVHDLIRGLSPYPTAWSELFNSSEQKHFVKIYKSEKEKSTHKYKNGTVICDYKNYLKVAVNDGFIVILELQLAGKKRMKTEEMLRGYSMSKNAYFS